MREKLKNITKKQKIVCGVISLVLIVCIVGGVFLYQSLRGREAVATLDMSMLYQDEIVTVGNIIVGISESGTASLVYEEIDLNSGYEVTEVIAVAGVYYEEGDVLATIDLEASEIDDTEDLDALEAAEEALTLKTIEVEAALIQAKSTYDQAIAAGESAQEVYDLAIQEIADDKAELADAIDELEADIEDMEDQLANGLDDDCGVATYTAELSALEADETATPEAIAMAEESLEKAEEEYEASYSQMETELSNSESSLSSKETEYAKFLTNESGLKIQAQSTYDSTINTYSNAYTQYTLTVDSLNESLEEAEDLVTTCTEALEDDEEDEAIIIDEDGNLLAPCSGYVMTVTEPTSFTMDNNTVESGLSITISDNDYAEIEISVSQDDIADVYIGMDANIVFDAYEDITIYSEVTSLSLTPSGDMASSVNYTVTIMCEIPEEEDITIFSSMTATVTFIEQQRNDVLLVSTNYIVYEDGLQYVYLEQEDGSIVKAQIETGFSDGFDVEVTAGVEEGDIVKNESAVIGIED